MEKEEIIKGLKFLGIVYNREISVELCNAYCEFLKDIDIKIFKKAIKEIIKEEKFMPSINVIIKKCEEMQKTYYCMILEYMALSGYFKIPKEYDKALSYLDTPVIPYWLKEDIKKYAKKYNNKKIEHINKNILETKIKQD